jgi:hypothetical protein
MNVVLIGSLAVAVLYTSRTVANIRCALTLRELETAVAALVEGALRRDNLA